MKIMRRSMFLTSGMDEEDVSSMISILYVCWFCCNMETPPDFSLHIFWNIIPSNASYVDRIRRESLIWMDIDAL